MHKSQTDFCKRVAAQFPSYFRLCQVLDVGSLNVNGTNRYLFDQCTYCGIDLGPGDNVDVVSPVHQWITDLRFRTIISTECFEHDRHWEWSIDAIIKLLEPKGLFLFTCASEGRAEHGTKRTDIYASPFTGDYYQNLTISDMLGFTPNFQRFEFDNSVPGDLYFWGIKR